MDGAFRTQADGKGFFLESGDPSGAAVLVLHGFTGSPWEVLPMGEALAARGLRVAIPCLPGHGGTPEDLDASRGEEWLTAAASSLATLSGESDHVSVVGHSMGALLGVLLAVSPSSTVRTLALLAPAARLKGIPTFIIPLLVAASRLHLVPRFIVKEGVDLSDSGERVNAPLLSRIPTARVADLFSLQKKAWSAAPRIPCPTLVVCGHEDHVVDNDAAVAFAQRIPRAQVEMVPGAHLIGRDTGRAQAVALASAFLGV